jgi:peptidoglycan/LPS O-acetylase OafA/YrhL
VLEAICLFFASPLASDGHIQPAVLQPLALQPLRFLGVAIIVFHHEVATWQVLPTDEFQVLWNLCKHIGGWGEVMVQFFLALSGFVLFLNQKGAPEVPSAAVFIWKRVVGVYPAYVASILLGIVADPHPSRMLSRYIDGHDLPGFLMIDSWAYPYLYAPNLPAWFVCSIFFNWLCFPRSYRCIRNVNSPGRAAFLAWLSSFAIPAVHTARWLHLTWDEPGGGSPPTNFAFWNPLSNWQPFVFGMCLARLTAEVELQRLPLIFRQAGASVACAILVIIFFLVPHPPSMILNPNDPTPDPAPNPLRMFFHKGPLLLPVFAVLLVLVPLGEDLVLRPQFLQNSWTLWLGSVSAELYLFHFPARLILHRFLDSPPSSLTFCVQFAVAIAMNALFKKLREASSTFTHSWSTVWGASAEGDKQAKT